MVTAKDYEVEVGSNFDVKSDYTGLEIRDDNKVKVTFEEAKNENNEDFTTAHADTYKAVYYVKPVNSEHPKYQISRKLIVRENTATMQAEVGNENAVTEAETSGTDQQTEDVEESEADYISYLKDIVEEECEQSVRAGVLIERLKTYEPELQKEPEPMAYVNYCENRELMNPRCQKLADLDAFVARQDKEWYADRSPKTNEPTMTAQMFFTVYYAEKGDKFLHHFKGKIDIGTGNGGIVSQLKLQNEMRLTDESWIGYQKGKGNEEFQKYMEDLTDMQNHILPYLQSFCSLEEKGVQERREQQVAEKRENRAMMKQPAVEAKNDNNERTGSSSRNAKQGVKKASVSEKGKKPSIHERLEINKKKIQEKQGKDKPERGADRGVR